MIYLPTDLLPGMIDFGKLRWTSSLIEPLPLLRNDAAVLSALGATASPLYTNPLIMFDDGRSSFTDDGDRIGAATYSAVSHRRLLAGHLASPDMATGNYFAPSGTSVSQDGPDRREVIGAQHYDLLSGPSLSKPRYNHPLGAHLRSMISSRARLIERRTTVFCYGVGVGVHFRHVRVFDMSYASTPQFSLSPNIDSVQGMWFDREHHDVFAKMSGNGSAGIYLNMDHDDTASRNISLRQAIPITGSLPVNVLGRAIGFDNLGVDRTTDVVLLSARTRISYVLELDLGDGFLSYADPVVFPTAEATYNVNFGATVGSYTTMGMTKNVRFLETCPHADIVGVDPSGVSLATTDAYTRSGIGYMNILSASTFASPNAALTRALKLTMSNDISKRLADGVAPSSLDYIGGYLRSGFVPFKGETRVLGTLAAHQIDTINLANQFPSDCFKRQNDNTWTGAAYAAMLPRDILPLPAFSTLSELIDTYRSNLTSHILRVDEAMSSTYCKEKQFIGGGISAQFKGVTHDKRKTDRRR